MSGIKVRTNEKIYDYADTSLLREIAENPQNDLVLEFCPHGSIIDFPEAREKWEEKCESGIPESFSQYSRDGAMEILKELGKDITERLASYLVQNSPGIRLEINTDSNRIETRSQIPPSRGMMGLEIGSYARYPEAGFSTKSVESVKLRDGWYTLLAEPDGYFAYAFGLRVPKLKLYWADDSKVSLTQRLAPERVKPVPVIVPNCGVHYAGLLGQENVDAVFIEQGKISGYLPARIDSSAPTSMLGDFLTDELKDRLIAIKGHNTLSVVPRIPFHIMTDRDSVDGSQVELYCSE